MNLPLANNPAEILAVLPGCTRTTIIKGDPVVIREHPSGRVRIVRPVVSKFKPVTATPAQNG